ncbi:aldose epimerase family protein [Marinifilum flexuosum]|uniref:aldose epimerase family protein n=1 Tax=Marinifilum flexuosum TaxID=1117708 RepID=UPI0024930A67|nr:aldose epimerase family protein [Marinifilum flexuosum]
MQVYTLKNKSIEIDFIARGGQIISIKVPDAKGNIADVVVGYDTVEEALAGDAYFGALCGRYANRIVGGEFEIDGKKYQLDCNNETNHLHGGVDGFNRRNWKVSAVEIDRYVQAYQLSLVSEDGDQNYPGKLEVSVIYGLTDDNQFVIAYEAQTSKPTVINLTSHPYFNLNGAGNGSAMNHELLLNASNYTPISAELGTTSGDIVLVKDTPFDFTNAKTVESACKTDHEQIRMFDGIDHNFVLDDFDGTIKLAGVLSDPESGRKMEVYTDQPGIQIYTGAHFDGSEIGKKGAPIIQCAGLAMETQIFPNSPNYEHFPNAILRSGEKYKHVCIYKFC